MARPDGYALDMPDNFGTSDTDEFSDIAQRSWQDRKDAIAQVVIALISWSILANVIWAVVHYSSFIRFWKFLGL